jgi:hypothetical protein
MEGCTGAFLHAVPDPSLNTSHVVVCEAGASRNVVRFETTTTGPCEVLVDGTTVGGNWLVHRLSVALP